MTDLWTAGIMIQRRAGNNNIYNNIFLPMARGVNEEFAPPTITQALLPVGEIVP